MILSSGAARDIAVQKRQPGGLHRNRFDRTVQPGRVRDDGLGRAFWWSRDRVHVHLRVQKHVHSNVDARCGAGSGPGHLKRMLLHGYVGWTRCCWCAGAGFLRPLYPLPPALTRSRARYGRSVGHLQAVRCGSSLSRPSWLSVWVWERSLAEPASTSKSVTFKAQRRFLSSTSGGRCPALSWRVPGSPTITEESFL